MYRDYVGIVFAYGLYGITWNSIARFTYFIGIAEGLCSLILYEPRSKPKSQLCCRRATTNPREPS